MNKKQVAIISIIAIVAVVISGSSSFMVMYNSGNERPIKGGADKTALTVNDLPNGWRAKGMTSSNYQNASKPVASGWNWGGLSLFTYTYSSNGRTWNLWITINSWNSTGIAHEQYLGLANGAVNFNSTSLDLGDERCIFLPSFPSNITFTNEAYGATYDLRIGNVIVTAGFDAQGSNIYYDTAWMKSIFDIEAAKLRQNE